MKVVWTYTRTYNHIEYYFFYPDLYMEWLCTYWINGVKTRSEQQELLSLLCLEVSSILVEDPDEAWETIQKANLIKEKAPGRAKGIHSSGKTDFNTSEAALSGSSGNGYPRTAPDHKAIIQATFLPLDNIFS